jgi:hypothetical protein
VKAIGGPVNTATKITLGVVLGAVGVALLGAGVFVANQWKLAADYNRWLTLTEAIEDEMERHTQAERAIRNRYSIEPITNEQKVKYWQEVGNSAYRASVTIAPLSGEMEDLSFLPWHGALNAARDDFLEHTDAWQAWYDEVYDFAGEVGYKKKEWTAPRSGPEISATFAAAERSAMDALPDLFVGDLRERVEAEFAN